MSQVIIALYPTGAAAGAALQALTSGAHATGVLVTREGAQPAQVGNPLAELSNALGSDVGRFRDALVKLGVPDAQAQVCAEGVRCGYALVAVDTPDSLASATYALLQDHQPLDVDQQAEQWRKAGWRFQADAPLGSPVYTDHHFQPHYQEHFAASGYTYEEVSWAYRFGHALATHDAYKGADWSGVEPYAQRLWEAHNPGTWERFRQAVRYAWDKVPRDQGVTGPD